MSKENKIKQFEEEQLDKLLVELKDIDNFKGFEDGAFKYSLGKYQASLLIEYINQLQQENKELKETLENNSKINVAEHKYASRMEDKYLIEHNILTELEKWLEEKINSPKLSLIEIITFKRCLERLQELKEGEK